MHLYQEIAQYQLSCFMVTKLKSLVLLVIHLDIVLSPCSITVYAREESKPPSDTSFGDTTNYVVHGNFAVDECSYNDAHLFMFFAQK